VSDVDFIRRINLDLLYLPFAAKLVELVTALDAEHTPFYATSGFRSHEEQQALWERGRRLPGAKKVTNSPAGYSAHNYGVAADLCRDGDVDKWGLQPDWHGPSYEVLGEAARKLGLEWGGGWSKMFDGPHVQLPLRRHGFTYDRLLAIYRLGGMAKVHDALDGVSW
jgi:peptidoglycan LD-endopeptidase CwlK